MGDANLYEAMNEWSERPDDERFGTFDEMMTATQEFKRTATTMDIERITDLEVVVTGDEEQSLRLKRTAAPEKAGATFSHWSFGQLCRRIKAPADFLRTLPAKLTAENINEKIRQRQVERDKTAEGALRDISLLFHTNEMGDIQLRAFLTTAYERIWNCDVISRLQGLAEYGWRVPPARPAQPDQKGSRPATEADVLNADGRGGGLSIGVGDMIAPAGLYASDHDFFAFMINEANRIDDGSDHGLARGFFCGNSEVGDKSIWIKTFLYEFVCGNHIVWSSSCVKELRLPHVNGVGTKFDDEFMGELVEYADASTEDDEKKIATTKQFPLGKTVDEVVDNIFGKRLMTKGDVKKSVELAEQLDYVEDPYSAWGVAQGVTERSKSLPHADARVAMDNAAGKILKLAF